MLAAEPPAPRRFTLHVDFLALDRGEARTQAVAYANALNQLRCEIDSYTARVSADGDWAAAATVFCGAPGPNDMDVCVDSAGPARRRSSRRTGRRTRGAPLTAAIS